MVVGDVAAAVVVVGVVVVPDLGVGMVVLDIAVLLPCVSLVRKSRILLASHL